MSTVMAAETTGDGRFAKWLRRLFASTPSVELANLHEATKRLESAATKIETAANNLDPLGDMIRHMREEKSPARSTKKTAKKK